MKLKKNQIFIGIIFSIISSWSYASDEQVREQFEVRYSAWKAWRHENWYLSCFSAGKEFRAITDLGFVAIPLIVEKIENNPEDSPLGRAIGNISKKRFDRSEWPQDRLGDERTAAEMYVQWWKEDRFKTGEQFTVLYDKWKSLKKENKDEEAEQIYQRIVRLGIPVLPYLIDIVEQEAAFISAISRLSDGALAQEATASECKKWWEKNKQRYEILTHPGPGHD